MPTDVKPDRHRFSRSIIQYAVWLYHRFTLSYRDIEELLFKRGIQVSCETIRDSLGQHSAHDLKSPKGGRLTVRLGKPDLWLLWTSMALCWMFLSKHTATLRQPKRS